ncbi:MAG: LysR family transcriptional regulator [Faecousia sp.]
MDIAYVREFVSLAKYGNFMAAAEELYISQSSLSKHIMSMEKELGHPLFNRTTRKVSLTSFGKSYLPYAQRIVAADDEFQAFIAQMEKEQKHVIRFGVLPAFIPYHAEEAVIEFKQKFPNYSVSLLEAPNAELLNRLTDGTCNFALMRTYEEPLPDTLVSIPLLKDNIALVTRMGKVFDRNKKTVTLKELEPLELISSTSPLQTKILEDRCSRLNIVSRLSRAGSIIDMIKKGVADGAILNRIATEYYQDDGSLQIIDVDPPVYNLVSLVYSKATPMTPAIRAFIDTVVRFVAQGEFNHG